MTLEDVTIIIVLHNSARYLRRCLRSVLAAAGGAQIVVVDNGSTDGGGAIVESLGGAQLMTSAVNRGYAGAINYGLTLARGPLIAPLNADTEVEPGWLRAQVAHLAANPEVGAVTPMILIDQDRGRINAMGSAIHPSGLSFCNAMGSPRRRAPQVPFPVPGLSGASFVIRRPLLEAMGGAPEFCFMGNDDVILSWVLRLMGHSIHCVPEAVVYHRYNLALDPEKLYYLERNRWIHLLTSLQGKTLAARAAPLLALEGAIMGYCALKGPAYVGAKLRAMRHGVGRPRFLAQRRAQLQALRQISDRRLGRDLARGLAWGQLAQLLGRGASVRGESLWP